MKFFKTADGRFINPQLVTYCYATTTETRVLARFFFQDDSVNVFFDSISYAESEIKAFLNHCEEI